jgi:hypothetical protein
MMLASRSTTGAAMSTSPEPAMEMSAFETAPPAISTSPEPAIEAETGPATEWALAEPDPAIEASRPWATSPSVIAPEPARLTLADPAAPALMSPEPAELISRRPLTAPIVPPAHPAKEISAASDGPISARTPSATASFTVRGTRSSMWVRSSLDTAPMPETTTSKRSPSSQWRTRRVRPPSRIRRSPVWRALRGGSDGPPDTVTATSVRSSGMTLRMAAAPRTSTD